VAMIMAETDNRRNDILNKMAENDKERNIIMLNLTKILELFAKNFQP